MIENKRNIIIILLINIILFMSLSTQIILVRIAIDNQTELITKIIPNQIQKLKRTRITNQRLREAYNYLVETGQIIEE